MPSTTEDLVQREVQKIVGLELVAIHRAADMRGFHFGALHTEPNGRSYGDFALHVQCPWRVEQRDRLLTGSADLGQPAQGWDGIDPEAWTYDEGNLQDLRIAEWLGDVARGLAPTSAPQDLLIVTAARATRFGGVEIDLTQGYCLVLFPDGSVSEDWRLFQPAKRDGPHVVVSGGRVEGIEG